MNIRGRRVWIGIAVALALAEAETTDAATRTKANNTTALNLAGSWVENAAPVSGHTALWTNNLPGANSSVIGDNITVGSLLVANPGGLVTIGNTAGMALTIDANGSATPAGVGIDLSGASQNMTTESSWTPPTPGY